MKYPFHRHLLLRKKNPKEHHFGGPSWWEDRAGELHCLRGKSKNPTGWRFPRKYTAFTNQKVEDVEVSSKYTAFFWSIQFQYMHRIIISEEFISYLTFAWWVYIPDMLWISNIFPVKKGAVLLGVSNFKTLQPTLFLITCIWLIRVCNALIRGIEWYRHPRRDRKVMKSHLLLSLNDVWHSSVFSPPWGTHVPSRESW